MKLSKPGPAIVIPNSLREGLAKLSPEDQVVAKRLIRAKVRRLKKLGPPPTYPLPAEELLLPSSPPTGNSTHSPPRPYLTIVPPLKRS